MDPEVGKESGDSKEVAETPSRVVETPTEVGEDMEVDGDQQQQESSCEEEDGVVAVSEFDFVSYLEESGQEGVPEGAFAHVDASVDNGVRAGMVVEIPVDNKGTKFWLASIASVYGPLLKLSYVGDSGKNFLMRDLAKSDVYPLGWCQMNKASLEPPDSVKASCPKWESVALQHLEDVSIDTISMHFIDGGKDKGVTPVERISAGMMLEVKTGDGMVFWPATILRNCGGLLELRMKLEEHETKLWRFYTSEVLFPLRFAEQHSDMAKYRPPVDLMKKATDLVKNVEDITKFLGELVNPVPADLIPGMKPPKHDFSVGQVLEFLPPSSESVRIGTVVTVLRGGFFVVRGRWEETPCTVVCHANSPDIFPLGTYIKRDEQAIDGKPAPASNFLRPISAAGEEGFEAGQLIELFDGEEDGGGLCRMAKVINIDKSLVRLELIGSKGTPSNIVLPHCSSFLFPLGWSVNNGIKCNVLRSMIPKKNEEEVAEEGEKEAPKVEEQMEKKPQEDADSSKSWCPVIYFNYQCYSASFLSRVRLAALPKSIGPGPVQLVMKEVMARLIGASYKSASVLRRLECKNAAGAKAKQPRSGFSIESLKGKSRVWHDLKGDVEVPARSDLVASYCREICQKLGACPYLVCPTLYPAEGGCPASCNSRPKTEFHAAEQKLIKFRTRNGRKKLNMPPRKEKGKSAKELSSKEGGDNGSDSDESNGSDPTSSVGNSRCGSPVNASDGNRKRGGRKEWENILPRSEMRTRGARLPDYKAHLNMRMQTRTKGMMEQQGQHGSHMQPHAPTRSSKSGPMKMRPAFRLPLVTQYQPLPKGYLPIKTNGASAAAAASSMHHRRRLSAEFEPAVAAYRPVTAGGLPVRPPPRLPRRQGGGSGPPPIVEVRLESNPELWSPRDTATFIASTQDCAHLAQFMVDDDVDGRSFMLLNFATAQDHWRLSLKTAIQLCRHVESVKLAHWQQFLTES